MKATDYDVAIIGGGIQGAGAAEALAARGYSVVLLEKNELGSGTSCKSSKLIHGGLRYLENFQFKLVWECLRERAILLKRAPDLVKLTPFYIPVYKHTRRSPLTIRAGLSLYAILSGINRSSVFRRINKPDWAQLDGLSTDQLQAVFQYYDARTDDRLLTQAVAQSAETLNAAILKDTQFLNAQITPSKHWRIEAQRGEEMIEFTSLAIVNAAGAWANPILDSIEGAHAAYSVDWVGGTHVVFPGELDKGVYYVEAPQDKRAVFAIPWYGNTMVGTTERIYTDDPDNIQPTAEEIDYLTAVYRHYFPHRDTQMLNAFAGLRVLPKSQGSAFRRPRETVFRQSTPDQPPLITLYGGKLTAFRATAESMTKQLIKRLPPRKAVANTCLLPLKYPKN